MLRQKRQGPRQRHRRDGATGSEQQRRHKADKGLDFPIDVGRAHRAPQKAGNQHTFAGHRSQRDCHHTPVERFIFHQHRHQSQQHALQRHGPDERRQTAAPEREQVQSHRQTNQEIQRLTHWAPPFQATSKANRQSRNAGVSKSGTRRNARRASSDSTSPTPTVTSRTPAANAPAPATGDNSPTGSTAWTSSTANNRSLTEAPCKIAANGGPLWSRTMTS